MSRFVLVNNGEREFLLNVDHIYMVSLTDTHGLALYTTNSFVITNFDSDEARTRMLVKLWTAHKNWIELHADWKGKLGTPLPNQARFINRTSVIRVTREHDMNLLWVLRFWFGNGDYAVKTFPGESGASASNQYMLSLTQG